MARPWQVPQLWQGKTVAVLASGESMSQAVADSLRGLPAIVINETYRLAPWADLLYAADFAWWRERPEALGFAGLKVTAQIAVPYAQVLHLKSTGLEGYDPTPGCIRTGGNGGYAGVHIAAAGGARRIELYGFDMRGSHWHGPHPSPLRNTPPERFEAWIARFRTLARELAHRGIEVVNMTQGSALDCFPFGDHESHSHIAAAG